MEILKQGVVFGLAGEMSSLDQGCLDEMPSLRMRE